MAWLSLLQPQALYEDLAAVDSRGYQLMMPGKLMIQHWMLGHSNCEADQTQYPGEKKFKALKCLET